MIRRTYAVIATLALLPALAACSATTTVTTDTTNSTASESGTPSHAVTLESGWAKAASGMSGVFGTLQNHTDEDLTITELSSTSADLVELHEVTADGVMQAISEPVVIPANGSYELAPGANHIMLMEMPAALLPGDTVTVTITFSDGSTHTIDALVKEYGGANESYDDLSHSEHGQDAEHGEHGEDAEHGEHSEHAGH